MNEKRGDPRWLRTGRTWCYHRNWLERRLWRRSGLTSSSFYSSWKKRWGIWAARLSNEDNKEQGDGIVSKSWKGQSVHTHWETRDKGRQCWYCVGIECRHGVTIATGMPAKDEHLSSMQSASLFRLHEGGGYIRHERAAGAKNQDETNLWHKVEVSLLQRGVLIFFERKPTRPRRY